MTQQALIPFTWYYLQYKNSAWDSGNTDSGSIIVQAKFYDISIIILSGDAQINAYLSADMNKAEIDTVAWETPNVQNVSVDSVYDMMSGNIYRYKIETTSATITFT